MNTKFMVRTKKSIQQNMMRPMKKLSNAIKNRDIIELITNQQKICMQINQFCKLYISKPILASSIQKSITDIIVNYIYKPLKQGLAQKQIKQQQVQKYHHLISRICSMQLFENKQALIYQTKKQIANMVTSRSSNQVAISFLKGLQPVPPIAMFQKMHKAFQSWKIIKQPDQHILHLNHKVLLDQKQNQTLTRFVCSSLNYQNCAILVGVKQQLQIQGVQLTNTEIHRIYEKIETIRRQSIHPAPCSQQIFSISFVKVQKKFGIQSMQQDKSLTNKQSYIIKIYTNSQKVGNAYFVIQPSKKTHKKYEYVYVKDPSKQSLSLKYYQQMHNAFKAKNYISKRSNVSIKNQTISFAMKQGIIGKIQKVQEVDKLKYGRIPIKKHTHQSILVISHNGEQTFKKFLKQSGSDDQNMVYYQIYENFVKKNKRRVFYMTHRKNVEELRRIIQQIDNQRKNLVLMKIKPQLILLKQNLFEQAYKLLERRYKSFYNEPIKVVFKKNELNQQNQYYFCFDSDEKAIFAFTFLQSSDIRSNFANPGKLNECQPFQNSDLYKSIISKDKTTDSLVIFD